MHDYLYIVLDYFYVLASLVESHERGRKHQNLLIKSENKRKSLLCGLYVRGFKKQLAIEEDLKAVFCKYGDIKDIYVDKEKVRIPSQYSK